MGFVTHGISTFYYITAIHCILFADTIGAFPMSSPETLTWTLSILKGFVGACLAYSWVLTPTTPGMDAMILLPSSDLLYGTIMALNIIYCTVS